MMCWGVVQATRAEKKTCPQFDHIELRCNMHCDVLGPPCTTIEIMILHLIVALEVCDLVLGRRLVHYGVYRHDGIELHIISIANTGTAWSEQL